MKRLGFGLIMLVCASLTDAQSTRPTTRPNGSGNDMKFMSADQVFDQMLKPATIPSRPLAPLPERGSQAPNQGSAAVKPGAPNVPLIREGTYIMDRLGRLTKTDKGEFEFTFESDGKALRDPPLILLPNLKLAQLEEAVTSQARDLKVRVTGRVTEYRGRNYLLLDMVIVPPDATQQF
ncbi:MAG TPA: hypothetical protein VK797_04165 [Tepidisphaeraceae bacterium]|nr:hypothetical protein [Tepidisphaeraceae bacterium]